MERYILTKKGIVSERYLAINTVQDTLCFDYNTHINSELRDNFNGAF